MRIEGIFTLLLLLAPPPMPGQTVPPGWKVVTDSKSACQIAVPPEWTHWSDSSGAAVFHDPTTAIAVVTSQPGQAFKPLTPALQKALGIPKEKMFENTATRIFYQDRVSRQAEDPNAYSASVPANGGTCSCRVVVVPSVSQDTAKKIVLTLGPVKESKS